MLYRSALCPICGLSSCMHRRPTVLHVQVEVNIPLEAKSIDVEIGKPETKPARMLRDIEPREVSISCTPQNGKSKCWKLGPGSLWGLARDTGVYAYFAEAELALDRHFGLRLELTTVRMSEKFADWLDGQFAPVPQINCTTPLSLRCFTRHATYVDVRREHGRQHDLELLGCWVANVDYSERRNMGAAASQLTLVIAQAKLFHLDGREEVLP